VFQGREIINEDLPNTAMARLAQKQLRPMMQERGALIQPAHELELALLRQGLPRRMGAARHGILAAARDGLGVRSAGDLQIFLNVVGARDERGRALREDGSLDGHTVYALFSYLQQRMAIEPGRTAPALERMRRAVYPVLGAVPADAGAALVRLAGYRDAGALRAFLSGMGYAGFDGRELAPSGAMDRPALFALFGFIYRMEPRLGAASGAVPSRTEEPRILFPVQPQDGRVEWHRGSFGSRSHRSGIIHRAIDIFAPEGRAVVAPLEGRVAYVGRHPDSPGGNVVVLVTDDGLFFLMSHLQTITAEEGQRIGRGGQVGTVGSTGRGLDGTEVTSPHLHFEAFRGSIELRNGRLHTRRTRTYNPADLF
jgi:murein DD-endopeptidase MepM/ murein hydrolase activator NlpD